MSRVGLYRDRQTSEVTEEHMTLHAGIATLAPLTIGAALMCNGTTLATFGRLGWTLHPAGVDRLTEEFMGRKYTDRG